MHTFKHNLFSITIILCMVCAGLSNIVSGQNNKGALILIEKSGDVSFSDSQGVNINGSVFTTGKIVPIDHNIMTGQDGKVVFLLSNGTLMTLTENTKMKVSSFEQVPFDPQGKTLGDLEEEPSPSNIEIDLDIGSLVVKTKKLDKKSSFEIRSAVGVAGIRGTEFQMATSPTQGVQLDVTESTVAFTPPGGQPVNVSQGGGLSVSNSGVATPRPLNPVAAQTISTTNQSATQATENVPMETVVTAIETESAPEPESEPEPNEQPSSEEEKPDNQDEQDIQENESVPSEEPMEETVEGLVEDIAEEPDVLEDDSDPVLDQSEQDSPPPPPEDSTREQSVPGEPPSEIPGEAPSETPGEAPTDIPADVPLDAPPSGEPVTAPTSPQKSAKMEAVMEKRNQPSTNREAKQSALENNTDAQQARKTAKVSPFSTRLAKFGLNDQQTNRFFELGQREQALILNEDQIVVKRLLSMKSFSTPQANAFFRYSKETREKILELDNSAIIAGLNQQIDEALLRNALSEADLGMSSVTNLPDAPDLPSTDFDTLLLSEHLKEFDQSEIMEEILVLSGGAITKGWIRTGEVASELLKDYDWETSSAPTLLSGDEVLTNPFYETAVSLVKELENDSLLYGKTNFIGGKNQIVVTKPQSLAPYFTGAVKNLVISSDEKLIIKGNMEWETPNAENTHLIIASGGELEISSGTKIKSSTSDLTVSSRQDINLENVEVVGSKRVSIRSLRDVEIKGGTLGASAEATVKARRNLQVDGLNFTRNVSNILMEATTVRLRNIDFPANAAVRLNSLKGPIQGKYPNFGTAVPAAQQIGRVNFIENVRSGGNLLHNRQAFDQFGNNIKIGKINRP